MFKLLLQYEFGQLVFKWFTFTKNFTLMLTQHFLRADFRTKSRFPFSMKFCTHIWLIKLFVFIYYMKCISKVSTLVFSYMYIVFKQCYLKYFHYSPYYDVATTIHILLLIQITVAMMEGCNNNIIILFFCKQPLATLSDIFGVFILLPYI